MLRHRTSHLQGYYLEYPFSYSRFSQYTIMEFQSNFIPSCSILSCFLEFKSNDKLQSHLNQMENQLIPIQSHLCKIQWKSAKLLRQTKVCLKKLSTKFHSISICMNFDTFKGILTCLLTMPINISFTTFEQVLVLYFARARCAL